MYNLPTRNTRIARLALWMAVAASLATHASAGSIPWRSGARQDLRLAKGDLAVAAGELAARPEASRVVLTMGRPVGAALRAQLGAAGVRLLAPLGGKAFFATLDASALRADALANLGAVSIEAIQAEWKLHPMLARLEVPEWAIVDLAANDDPIIGAYALFHPDVDLAVDAVAVASAYGATVRDTLETVNGLVIEIPYSLLPALADADAVQWLEPALPRFATTNSSNRAITEANLVQAVPYNLTGAGVTVLVYDGGTARSTHVDFGGRLFVRDASGMDDHPTHVSGTIGGSGSASGGTHKGMAPGVILQSYGFEYDGSGIFLYTNPGDIEDDYDQAINTYGADISNNSIGTNTESNGFDCAIQGDYGTTDTVIDAIVRGSLGAPFRVVWANGNERQGSRCDVEGFGDYFSTAPPATAKNHITVGALNSNDDSMTSFSSWGPTDDGRLKPDVSAPGCQSNDDLGVTSTFSTSNTAYGVYCGTSMASPTVCGLSALLLEDYRVQFPSQPDPRNSTLKILLAQTATDRGNVGPDYQFGYGSVRIKQAIDFMRTGNFLEDSLDQGGELEWTVDVAPGTSQLKLTLAWDDVPGTPNVNPALVNDLDLEVIDPSSTQRFPWTLNPANPSAAAVQTSADHINNIEQVLVNSPASGTWTVRVRGFNVPQGPQPFSLCSSTSLIPQPSVQILFPSGTPSSMTPDVATTVDVQIRAINDTLVGGSALLYVRYDGGAFVSVPLTPLGGEMYQATLPAPTCAAVPEYYISADGAVSGNKTNPPDAPATLLTASVGTYSIFLHDSFETDLGWQGGVAGDTATTGVWNRMDPQATAAQPEDDVSNPGTICWVTNGLAGGSLGANDVDGGFTTLRSPTIDLTGQSQVRISYHRWYSNNTGGAPNADTFRVDVSNNNGSSWVNAETVGPAGAGTSGGWIYHEFTLDSFVTPTAQVRIRFIAEDAGSGSLIEAAVDEFRVDSFGCSGSFTDCNNNGIVDDSEIALGLVADNNGNGIPDPCDTEPGVSVTESGGSTAVTEGGPTDSYSVVLLSEPAADVTITIVTDGQTTALPSPLTFTTADWGVPQVVTVTAVNDAAVEGAHNSLITHSAASADAGYDGIAVANVSVAITDNDYLKGDMNCDGVVDSFDVGAFTLALTDDEAYLLAYPDCNILNADMDNSGIVDVFDIAGFVDALTGP